MNTELFVTHSTGEGMMLSLLTLLCLTELITASSKNFDLNEKYINLKDIKSGGYMKRSSLVDGGVFVPHKSTTVVYKSRLVPVTFGFIINKQTLLDNPTLSKLGLKLLDKNLDKDTGKKDLRVKPNCSEEPTLKILKLLRKVDKGNLALIVWRYTK